MNNKIMSAEEQNSDYILQLFKYYFTYLVQLFIQAINTEKSKYNRKEPIIAEDLITIALIIYNSLVLEGY